MQQHRNMLRKGGAVRAGARAVCGAQGDSGGGWGPRGGGECVRPFRGLLLHVGAVRARAVCGAQGDCGGAGGPRWGGDGVLQPRKLPLYHGGVRAGARAVCGEQGDCGGAGDLEGVARACKHIGLILERTGELPAAACALVQGLAACQHVERDVGAHDDRRVSLFELQQEAYMVLQSVLLGLGQPGWALGLAEQAKGRALLCQITGGGNSHSNEDDASVIATDCSYEDVCEAWWREVQQDAQAEGDAVAAEPQSERTSIQARRILEYSFLLGDRLAIWVLTGTGELLGCRTVSTKAATPNRTKTIDRNDRMFGSSRMFQCPRKFNQEPKYLSSGPIFGPGSERETAPVEVAVSTVGETIAEALEIMEVRGRDAMMRQAQNRENAEDAVQEDISLMRSINRDQKVLGSFYQHLLAPVEAHLQGATEVLIIPHKELFDVPWAALFDNKTGQYLIERYVLRVAPSLRVARRALHTLRGIKGPEYRGHALVVGNPLPTRGVSLPKAEVEAKLVAKLLRRVGFQVHALMRQEAIKAAVLSKIEGATWGHFACHGDWGRDSIMLAESPAGAATGDSEVHENVRCDGCELSPIRGAQWKCSVCADYDLCDL